MKEEARTTRELAHAYAQPHSLRWILNVETNLEGAPPALIAQGIGLWPMCLNDTERYIPSADIPGNELTAEMLAQGLAVALRGG